MRKIHHMPSGMIDSTRSRDHPIMLCFYSVAYLGPSVTTYTYRNPAYRIYEMDGIHSNTTFQLIDHHNYFLNLTTANAENNATWQYLYGAKVR